jgi:hypothetical protein
VELKCLRDDHGHHKGEKRDSQRVVGNLRRCL